MASETPLKHAFLEVQDAYKAYGSIQALRGVSFDIEAGEIHGLCGHNGAGKSTLVKILLGLTRPDRGTFLINGHPIDFRNPRQAEAHGVSLVDQELSLVPVLSIADNLLLGGINVDLLTRPSRMRRKARRLLERVGLGHLPLDTLVERLPIGERQLVEIARSLGRGPKLLILDEPTARLSDAEIERVFKAVRDATAQGGSVVYVSHRLDEVLSLCHRVTVLRDGQRVGTHHVEGLKRGQLIDLMLGEMGHGTERTPGAEAVRLRAPSHPRLAVRNMDVGSGVRGFTLDAGAGDIVGLAGQVGSGTSEVIRALGGLTPEAKGEIHVDGVEIRLGSPRRAFRAGLTYISGDRQSEGLFPRQSVEHNLVANRLDEVARGGIVLPRWALRLATRLAALIGIDAKRVRSPVIELSGGNQQKVLVGRSLERSTTKVLLLDDPTRGVDVQGRAEVHELIRRAARDSRTTVLMSSTEVEELLEVADVIVTMFSGRVVSVRARAETDAASILAEMTMDQHEGRKPERV
jgi:ABC-type sugar transport system ATPase subunit